MDPRTRPDLVATDLDGTLLDSAGAVSPFTREVLGGLWDRGIETLFVTARPPRWIDDLADAVGGHGYAICANGAFLYDVHARRVVQEDLLDLAVVADLIDDLRRELPGVGFALEHAGGMHLEREYGRVGTRFLPADATFGPLADSGLTGAGKLLARIPGDGALGGPAAGVRPRRDRGEVPEFITRVTEVVGDRAVVAYSGAAGLAEIGPSGVSKASALERWCLGRGIGADRVWAFGDMPNDIPMLSWAGRSFAVDGAPADVRAIATDVCGSNDEDGVARALLPLLRDGTS